MYDFLWKFILVQSLPKIKSIRIVDNPFDDIVPRITAAEKCIQQRAEEQAQREREEEQQRKGAKKWGLQSTSSSISTITTIHFFRNVKLLDFVRDEDEAEEGETTDFEKKPIYRPECTWGNYPSVSFDV